MKYLYRLFFGVSLVILVSVDSLATVSTPSCRAALDQQQRKTIDETKAHRDQIGSMQFRSASGKTIKTHGLYKILGSDVKMNFGLVLDTPPGTFDVPAVGEKKPLNPSNKYTATRTYLEVNSNGEVVLSANKLDLNFYQMTLVPDGEVLKLNLKNAPSWMEVKGAASLGAEVTEQFNLERASYVLEAEMPPTLEGARIQRLKEMGDEYFIPTVLPMLAWESERLQGFKELVQLLDVSLDVIGSSDGSRVIRMSGNPKFLNEHVMFFQYVLTLLSTGLDQKIAATWDQAKSSLTEQPYRFDSSDGISQILGPVSNFVPQIPLEELEFFLKKHTGLSHINHKEFVVSSMEHLFGQHWLLALDQLPPLERQEAFLGKQLKRVFPLVKKMRKTLGDSLFADHRSQELILESFKIDDSPSFHSILFETHARFMDRFKSQGLFVGVSGLGRTKHADVYWTMDSGSMTERAGTYALMEIAGTAEHRKLMKQKLDELEFLREKVGIPAFTYIGNIPLYLLPKSDSGEFSFDLQSPALTEKDLIRDIQVSQLKDVEKRFRIVKRDGIPYLQSTKENSIFLPLDVRSGRISIPSMSCAQWTRVVLLNLFPELKIPSFSSPVELIQVLRQGQLPQLKTVGFWQ